MVIEKPIDDEEDDGFMDLFKTLTYSEAKLLSESGQLNMDLLAHNMDAEAFLKKYIL